MTRFTVAGTSLAALLLTSMALAGDCKSGLQVGKRGIPAFHPLNLTGSKAGQKNCLV
jgi:hypothetical protein